MKQLQAPSSSTSHLVTISKNLRDFIFLWNLEFTKVLSFSTCTVPLPHMYFNWSMKWTRSGKVPDLEHNMIYRVAEYLSTISLWIEDWTKWPARFWPPEITSIFALSLRSVAPQNLPRDKSSPDQFCPRSFLPKII